MQKYQHTQATHPDARFIRENIAARKRADRDAWLTIAFWFFSMAGAFAAGYFAGVGG